jgi:hypothetical protein
MMTAQERVSPFANVDLSDFATPSKTEKKTDPTIVEEVAANTGFPSRQPVQHTKKRGRPRSTGRNVQINLKVTSDARDLLFELADRTEKVYGEIFEDALLLLKAKLDAEEGK